MRNWKDLLLYIVLIIMNIILSRANFNNYIAVVISWFMFTEIKKGND